MANPAPSVESGTQPVTGRNRYALAAAMTAALFAAGCSFDLSSMPGDKDKPVLAAPAVINAPEAEISPKEAAAFSARAQTLAQAGQNTEALAAYGSALNLDPHNAQTFYNRGLLYQAEKQYEFAIADFTSANGLTPQQPDPLIGRALCYVATNKLKEAAADLDEAVGVAPQNGQAWSIRGHVYERLGDRSKAADSYSRAVLLRPKDEAARNGLARTGKAG
jgi:tetratricopeptide (TPR) repeat protein